MPPKSNPRILGKRNEALKVSRWSELSPEILLTVAEHLETQQDLLNFRSVCQKWRKSASFSLLPNKKLLSPILPHKLSTPTPNLLNDPPFNRLSDEISGNPLNLVSCCVFLLRSNRDPELPPWMITVEELNPGKLYLQKPLSRVAIEHLPENIPKVLDLSNFHVVELGKCCSFRVGDNTKDKFQWENWGWFNLKVVLFLDPNCKTTPMNTIGDFTALVLHGRGDLAAIRLKTEEMRIIRVISGVRKVDDIVNVKGAIYAVDRKGRAYQMKDYRLSCVVKDPIGQGCSSDRKKRLVVSCGELYLVHQLDGYHVKFMIYKLNEEQKKWDEVKGIGDDRILFVTLDGYFFASVNDLPGWKGNCIVFHRRCFPTYNDPDTFDYEIFKTWRGQLDIVVFHFEGGDCGPITSYPGYSDVLWPPPMWIGPNSYLSKYSEWISEDDGQAATDYLCQESTESICTKRIPTLGVEVDSQARAQTLKAQLQDNPSVEALGIITPVIQHKKTTVVNPKPLPTSSSSESVECVVSKDKFQGLNVNPDILPSTSKKICTKNGNIFQRLSKHRNDLVQEKVPSLNNDDRTPPAIDSSIQLNEDESSKVKFQGVDVSTNLVPILNKIWDKHGNIIQGHVVHSNGLQTWGLESLAKIILILQSSSATDSQAKYLDATLLDLQLMHFRVDWLVPFVKCALVRRKRKEELGIIAELGKKKDMLVAEVSAIDKELDKHLKLLNEDLSISSKLDPTKVLS